MTPKHLLLAALALTLACQRVPVTRIPRSLGPKSQAPGVATRVSQMKTLMDERFDHNQHVDSLYAPDWRGYDLPAMLHTAANTDIADIGCGTGPVLAEFLDADIPFGSYYAVDLDPPALQVVRHLLRRHPNPARDNVHVVVNSEDSVHLLEASVDVMWSNNGHLHLPMDTHDYWHPPNRQLSSDGRSMLRSMYVALRSGGVLHVIEEPPPKQAGVEIPPASLDYSIILDPYMEAGFQLAHQGIIHDPSSPGYKVHVVFQKPVTTE